MLFMTYAMGAIACGPSLAMAIVIITPFAWKREMLVVGDEVLFTET